MLSRFLSWLRSRRQKRRRDDRRLKKAVQAALDAAAKEHNEIECAFTARIQNLQAELRKTKDSLADTQVELEKQKAKNSIAHEEIQEMALAFKAMQERWVAAGAAFRREGSQGTQVDAGYPK